VGEAVHEMIQAARAVNLYRKPIRFVLQSGNFRRSTYDQMLQKDTAELTSTEQKLYD
jgi:hypothetical protein